MVPFRPNVNGFAEVDVVGHPWPDGMGAPTGPEAPLFAAWALGAFGPSTSPGSLQRAIGHASGWPGAEALVARHQAFVRVRTSYVSGASSNAALLPPAYNPLVELLFVTDVALAICRMKDALAFYDPSGEALSAPADVESRVDRHSKGGEPPLEAWVNVRMHSAGQFDGKPWTLYDTVGLDQLDLQDHEGLVPTSLPDPDMVPGLLYSMPAYDLAQGGVLVVTDTATDLAGRDWRAAASGDSLLQPPRQVLRWFLESVGTGVLELEAGRARTMPRVRGGRRISGAQPVRRSRPPAFGPTLASASRQEARSPGGRAREISPERCVRPPRRRRSHGRARGVRPPVARRPPVLRAVPRGRAGRRRGPAGARTAVRAGE